MVTTALSHFTEMTYGLRIQTLSRANRSGLESTSAVSLDLESVFIESTQASSKQGEAKNAFRDQQKSLLVHQDFFRLKIGGFLAPTGISTV